MMKQKGRTANFAASLPSTDEGEWPGGTVWAFQIGTEGWGERPLAVLAGEEEERAGNGRFQSPVLVLIPIMRQSGGYFPLIFTLFHAIYLQGWYEVLDDPKIVERNWVVS
ncbi:MAG: hypothetical protein R6X34_11310 [Chloroflexota bacterium]